MKKKIISMFMVAIMVLSMSFVCSLSCDAASKKSSKKSSYWYYSNCGKKSQAKEYRQYNMGTVYKVKFEGNKVVVYGSLQRTKKRGYDQLKKGTYLKSKKRTYTLSKDVKYYAVGGGMGPEIVDAEYIKSAVSSHNGLVFYFHRKNGKVVEMAISS